jgi:uncharacterized repeat protein (TIGR02543 family)
MKKFFKKVKALFMFLLIVPMMFVFGACKNNDNNDNGGSNNPGIEQPGGLGGEDDSGGSGEQPGDSGGEDVGGEDPETPPVEAKKTFNLSVNYALPTYLNGLIDDEDVTPEVDDGYTLPTFDGTEYENYFVGWYTTDTYEEESKVEDVTLTAEENANVSLYAKWSTEGLEDFFCTPGVVFEINGNCAIPVEYTGTSEIVIISKYVMNGETQCYVDRIGANCFKNNKVIKEFRTSMIDFAVGSNAFENSNLEKIDFSKVVTLDNYAFKDSKVKTAVFSNKISELSPGAFFNCTELETLDFSAITNTALNYIPSTMFYGCSKLKNIDLSVTMTKINESAFEGCDALENIEFLKNSSITEVESRVFANCEKLENVEIPATIVSYGTAVFAGSNVVNMTISNMFYNSAVADFSFTTKFGDLSATLKSVTFKGIGITKIYSNYFSGYSALETLVMNNQISEIETNAFLGCSSLKNITFSTALVGDNFNIDTLSGTKWYTDIEEYLTSESTNAMVVNGTLVYISNSVTGNFVVGDDVTHIVADIFAKNQNITSVAISKNVEYINKYAFYKSKVTNITINNQNEHYTVDNGTLEKFSGGEVVEGVTVGYSALYKLESGVKTTLISYVANVSGGLFIIPETVGLVYNSAFNSNYVPYYVYVSKPSAVVDLVTKFNIEEKAPRYLFGDTTISTESSNVNASIYKYLSADKYDIPDDPELFYVDFDGLTGNYFVFFEIIDPFGVKDPQIVYYLIDADGETITDISTIYPNFSI